MSRLTDLLDADDYEIGSFAMRFFAAVFGSLSVGFLVSPGWGFLVMAVFFASACAFLGRRARK